MTSDEYAAMDAKLIISEVEDLKGAISIGSPSPTSKGPITFESPIVLINFFQ